MVKYQLESTKHTLNHQAQKVSNHPFLVGMARLGFVVTGILHLMIGWIALKIAMGMGGGEASNSGAMQEIAATPGGQIFLWVMTASLLALGLWRLSSIAVERETKAKVKAGILGIVYLVLGLSTLGFARGNTSSDGQKASSLTSQILNFPGGKALIILAGLAVLGVGIYGIVKGIKRRFIKDLEAGASSGNIGKGITLAGTIGYTARGIAFLVLGGLMIFAAATVDPSKAAGMDSALRTIGDQPFGAILLLLTAVGFMLYGIYSIARAKYTNEI